LPALTPREELLDDFFEALALGVADYYRKVGAFQGIGLALSGGRDSLLTLLVAWRTVQLLHPELEGAALKAKVGSLLTAFAMPSRYSSEGTRGAAARICDDLGVTLKELSVEEAFVRELEATATMLGPGSEPTELTRQNIQARIRGTRMWNWANSSRALFLQTGNMSEKALGYTTVAGDLEGSFSVIANLPKTVVIALLERLGDRFAFPGIEATLATMPGPELAPDQSGEAELMPYEVLDACLYLHAAEKLSAEEVVRALTGMFPGHPHHHLEAWAKKFVRLFTQSIFKWVRAPMAIHVGALELDRERALQLPVVQRTEWSGD
jgi:NAD+ synthase (glutamine-hydrolysing)